MNAIILTLCDELVRMDDTKNTMLSQVELTAEGYYKIREIPSSEELKKYYQEKYFQSGKQYRLEYTEEETAFLRKRVELKLYAVKEAAFKGKTPALGRALEIGVGEGFTLQALKDQGYQVLGLDYSDFAIGMLHPTLLPFFRHGNVDELLKTLLKNEEKFDLVWLDNVLEHTPEPEALLKKCHQLLSPGGTLVVEVPNDFSPTQIHLLSSGNIDSPFWINSPDHLCYFSKDSLESVAKKTGFSAQMFFADFPIDFFLFNPNTNYRKTPLIGRSCHEAKIQIETLIMNQGQEKAINLFRALGDAGLGRQIVGIFSRD